MNAQEIFKILYDQRLKRISLYYLDNSGKLIFCKCTLQNIEIKPNKDNLQIILKIKKFRKIKTTEFITNEIIKTDQDKEFITIPNWDNNLIPDIDEIIDNGHSIDYNNFSYIVKIAKNIDNATYLISQEREALLLK